MRPEEPARTRGRRGKRANAGRRVRSAIDRIVDAYFALCLDTGRIYDANPAAEALIGTSAEELLRCEFGQLVGPSHREAYQSLESRLDAGEDAEPLELALERKSGEQVAVELSVASHTIAGKRLAIFVARERLKEIRPRYSTRTSSHSGILATRDSTARTT